MILGPGTDIYHLLTETEGNSVFCGPETVDVSRGEAEYSLSIFKSHLHKLYSTKLSHYAPPGTA